MALILAIETSTPVCSVALFRDEQVISSAVITEGQSHASKITILIENILKEAGVLMSELQAVAVSKGPGSYTGLRIGVSTAKGICYALSIPLISVCSLQLMAETVIGNKNQFPENSLFCPMIDARRMEVYSAIFDKKRTLIREIQAQIITQNSFDDYIIENKLYFFGNGAAKCKDVIINKNVVYVDDIFPIAKDMLMLANQAFLHKQFEDVAYFEPFYLKDFVATVPKKKI